MEKGLKGVKKEKKGRKERKIGPPQHSKQQEQK